MSSKGYRKVNTSLSQDLSTISLNYEKADLKHILPWTGSGTGPQAFVDTFAITASFKENDLEIP